MQIRDICISLFLGLAIALMFYFSNFSVDFIVGFPLFLYSIFPLGIWFLLCELTLFIASYFILFSLSGKFSKKYVLRGFLTAIYIALNIISTDYINIPVERILFGS